MTTNIEHAAEVIKEAFDTAMSSDTRSTWAYQIAQALDNAGRLMPNSPEPKWPGFWEVDGLEINSVDKDGEVLIEYASDPEYIYGMQTKSLWLNRDQVVSILAAFNHAEQEQDNG